MIYHNKTIQVDPGTEGWWLGECNGRTGLFPANFVQTDLIRGVPKKLATVRETSRNFDNATETAEASKSSAVASASKDLTTMVDNREKIIEGIVRSDVNARRSAGIERTSSEDEKCFEVSERPVSCVGEALYDYQAADEDELELHEGDQVIVTDKVLKYLSYCVYFTKKYYIHIHRHTNIRITE